MSAAYHDLGQIFSSIRPRLLLVAAMTGATFAITALVLALSAPTYRVQMVLAPVTGQRSSVTLQGAASSILGGSVQLGGNGFEASQDVVAYLLKSRVVLLSAADTVVGPDPLAEALVDLDPARDGEERLLLALRKLLKVTQSKETRFVVVSASVSDSGAARAFVRRAVAASQRLFTRVAQSQAHELLLAQERRLDSAASELRRAEERLLQFNEHNRIVPPNSRPALERVRLERAATQAADVQTAVNTDRQTAMARELEEAPALAVVEPIPDRLAPVPKQIFFRSGLLAMVLGVGLLLALFSRELLGEASAPRA